MSQRPAHDLHFARASDGKPVRFCSRCGSYSSGRTFALATGGCLTVVAGRVRLCVARAHPVSRLPVAGFRRLDQSALAYVRASEKLLAAFYDPAAEPFNDLVGGGEILSAPQASDKTAAAAPSSMVSSAAEEPPVESELQDAPDDLPTCDVGFAPCSSHSELGTFLHHAAGSMAVCVLQVVSRSALCQSLPSLMTGRFFRLQLQLTYLIKVLLICLRCIVPVCLSRGLLVGVIIVPVGLSALRMRALSGRTRSWLLLARVHSISTSTPTGNRLGHRRSEG